MIENGKMCKILGEHIHKLFFLRTRITGILFNDLYNASSDRNGRVGVCRHPVSSSVHSFDMHHRSETLPIFGGRSDLELFAVLGVLTAGVLDAYEPETITVGMF